MDARSIAVAQKTLLDLRDPSTLDLVEAKQAERTQRLAELVNSDVWKLDLLPILVRMHDDYLDAVKQRKVDIDALKVFDDLLTKIDGAIRIGAGAMERVAARRVKAATATNELNQRQAPKPLSEF